MLRFIISKRKPVKLNNNGMTMTEMIVAFALLALFMVAATRMISYTADIYYAAKGASYGMEVSNMIANKLVGQLEGASRKQPVSFESADSEGEDAQTPDTNPIVRRNYNSTGDIVKFCDATGSVVSVYVENGYVVIHYDEVTNGTVPYDAVDWKFDSKAYMGYVVKGLHFENPGSEYPDNVLRITMDLYSAKYGEYHSSYFVKCVNAEEIRWE